MQAALGRSLDTQRAARGARPAVPILRSAADPAVLHATHASHAAVEEGRAPADDLQVGTGVFAAGAEAAAYTCLASRYPISSYPVLRRPSCSRGKGVWLQMWTGFGC